MIKIAYIIDIILSPTGGTEKQLLMLMNEIDKSKFKPYLICLRNSEWLQNNDLPFDVHILNVNSLLSFSSLRGILKFKKIHKKEKFDIVQTFFIDGNIFGTIAAKIIGCKKVISSRRNIGYWHNKFHIRILRFLKKWTSYYLCNSMAAKKMIIKIENVDPSKTHVIYNGIDFRKFDSINNEVRQNQRNIWGFNNTDIIIGAITNLRAVKNIDLIIETASVLIREFHDLKFVVVGEGDLRRELQNKITQLNLTKIFFLVGRIDNIVAPLSAFDIAVMPSLSESFSNSLIEYMAVKLPIISSDSGGNIEAIEHNKTGLLFSLEDKNGLFENIRMLLIDKTLSRQLAENAYNTAIKNYDISTMIMNHENYYENVVNK